ncbi:hypothetical protein [Nonomuraea jabiensis]|uniref:hypothetical protein n=1 Tax=Nonomuraea jabiensis TaxID=882448 RepID=UPI003D7025C6
MTVRGLSEEKNVVLVVTWKPRRWHSRTPSMYTVQVKYREGSNSSIFLGISSVRVQEHVLLHADEPADQLADLRAQPVMDRVTQEAG